MLSQRESYTATKWTKFLWWLSTAEKELLSDCVIDRNRYSIIGMTVMATWLFATLAWTYFFSTVVSNIYTCFALGIFMGGIILTIDRALIKGINKFNKNKITPLLFRGVLALTIGMFMAQPALLYLFDKEIHLQISLDNEQKKKDKLQQQQAVYSITKKDLLDKKTNLQKQLDDKYKEVAVARNNFIAETDGTGGSKKIGLKDIAQAKQKEYLKLDGEYQQMSAALLPQIKSIDNSLNSIESTVQNEQQSFNTLLNDGFLTRSEALNNLLKTNTALQFRYYLLVVILLLIELMPVIAKTILPAGTYDEKVHLREKMEKEIVQKNMVHEQQLKEMYNQLAFEQDTNFIKNFFTHSDKERHEKMRTQMNNWKENDDQSFDTMWNGIKKDMLTKQEH
ncbi:hypothetical protein GALL_45890 [mine drainage metagenome]|uniref:DUF4407 domain-containing protein n=1 Tax=mine drainage metagenome TaxID=410659 RepID=A0A1J5SZW6_9ZZZZ